MGEPDPQIESIRTVEKRIVVRSLSAGVFSPSVGGSACCSAGGVTVRSCACDSIIEVALIMPAYRRPNNSPLRQAANEGRRSMNEARFSKLSYEYRLPAIVNEQLTEHCTECEMNNLKAT
jgi:hypothetical protein